ncbi:MAG: hypothetical protein WCW33_06660 [Candidatus Babeliales bacterium]
MREKVLKLKWIFIYVVLGIVSGASAALIVLAWFSPFVSSDSYQYFVKQTTTQNTSDIPHAIPDPVVQRQVEFRVIDIWDTTKAHGNLFTSESHIGKAALLSSDGWAVFFSPRYNVARSSSFVGVDRQGVKYTIEKIVLDKHTGFVYLKFKGNEFRAISFPNWNDVQTGTGLWALEANTWKRTMVGDAQTVLSGTYDAAEPYSKFSITGTMAPQSLLISDQGHFVGYIDEEGRVVLAWTVQDHVSVLLEKGVIQNKDVGWNGSFVIDITTPSSPEVVSGFYITKLTALSTLKIGDVVSEIQHQAISADTLAQQISSAPDQFTATVWRGGKKSDILVKKTMGN